MSQPEYNGWGFNKDGVHAHTMTKWNPEGFDANGFSAEGKPAFSRNNLYADLHGKDAWGFNTRGIHTRTGTKWDEEGYDQQGRPNKRLVRAVGRRLQERRAGEIARGRVDWGRDAINTRTGTKWDEEGYDVYGYDADGFDRYGQTQEGFDSRGIHLMTGTRYAPYGFDVEGYDENGFDLGGFDRRSVHRDTGTKWNPEGFDSEGYDKHGRTEEHIDRDGRNRAGFGAGYPAVGLDKDGYDHRGFNRRGLNKLTGSRWDPNGFDRNWKHRDTDNQFDSEGYYMVGPTLERLSILGWPHDSALRLARD